MKKFVFFLAVSLCLGANAQVKEDFVPSPNNQPGKQYPMVNSERCVRVRVEAPDAQSVKLDIGGVKYDLVKGEDGAWIGESAPQDEGFHYYQLNIDGANVQTETEDLAQSGVNAHFYVSPGTAHEWQSWRRALYQFAQLLFK